MTKTKRNQTKPKKRPKKRSEQQEAMDRRRRMNRRLLLVKMIFCSILVFFVYRVGYFKFVRGEEFEIQVYERMANTEQEIKALRGGVVDRNNKTLVSSNLVYHIILEPIILNSLSEETQEKTYQILSEYTEKSVEEIRQLVVDNPSSWYRVLERNISAEDKEALADNNLKGMWFEESFIRTYPKQTLAAQILGFYNGTNGQYGVEQAYNQHLEGKNGRTFPQVQDGNITITEVAPAEEGHTVVLTIDEVVQQYIEQTMEIYIEEYSPINASAVVMSPKTGEIYGMYSYPTFNPNTYTNLESVIGSERWNQLSAEEQSAELNRAWQNFNIQFSYEPGSTLKPMVAAIAVEENYVDVNHLYNCTGHNNVSGTIIRCWKTSGHGIQTLEQVLANSCNSGMIQLSEVIPGSVFFDYLVQFGLGRQTGIDLPGEAKGILHALDDFGPVEQATASMGQGITVTPMQLMSSFSALINGGYLMEPYVVSQIVDTEGGIVEQVTPTVRRQVVSEETADLITRYLRATVTEGTGGNSNIGGYTIAGKTGTAEKLPRGNDKHIISFVGYAPVDDPEVIALVLFDEAPDDSGAPTKAFNDMMQNILPYLGVETYYEEGIQTPSSFVVPSVEGMSINEAIQVLGAQQATYEVIGVGSSVVSQYPAEGTKLPLGTAVKLYVESDGSKMVYEVPNLLGLTMSDAREMVEGFFVLEEQGTGTIRNQIPASGTKVEQGSKIIVQTSIE